MLSLHVQLCPITCYKTADNKVHPDPVGIALIYGVVSENEGQIFLSPWKEEKSHVNHTSSLELWYRFEHNYNVTQLYHHFYAAVLIQKTWRVFSTKRRTLKRTRLIKEELMAVAWNPDRVRQCFDEDILTCSMLLSACPPRSFLATKQARASEFETAGV